MWFKKNSRSKKKAILYTGSFDPIHLGHLEAITFLSIKYPEHIIYVMPQIYKEKGGGMLSLNARVESVSKAVSNLHNVDAVNPKRYASDIDGRSLYKMANLVKMYHRLDELKLAVGKDTVWKIRDFEHSMDLMRDYQFVVIYRAVAIPDSGIQKDYFYQVMNKEEWFALDVMETVKDISFRDIRVDISSSLIKSDFSKYKDLIPYEALKYIETRMRHGEEL